MAAESIYSALMEIKGALEENWNADSGSDDGGSGSGTTTGTLIIECVSDGEPLYRSDIGLGFYFTVPEQYTVDNIYNEFASGRRILFHCAVTYEMIAAVAEEGDMFGATDTYFVLDGIIRENAGDYGEFSKASPSYIISVSAFKDKHVDVDSYNSGDLMEFIAFAFSGQT